MFKENEKLLDYFVNKAIDNGFNIDWIIEDDKVPIEYCQSLLDKKMTTMDKLGFMKTLVKRKDCPKELIVDCCRTACDKFQNPSNFLTYVCHLMKDNIEELPEEISDMIIKYNSLEVSKNALVPEKVQKDTIEYLFDLKQTDKEIIEDMPYVNNFLIQQLSIPVDSMAKACMFMKYVNRIKWDFNKNYHNRWDYEEALVLFEFMRHPLKDEVVESLFKKNYKEAFDTFVIDVEGVFDYLDEDDFINMNVIPKIVSNASVSDYAMMKILSSIEDDDTLKRVNMLIDLNKGKRDAYRKKKRNRKG